MLFLSLLQISVYSYIMPPPFIKILEHWTKFKEYDSNGDLTLDVEEVSMFSFLRFIMSMKFFLGNFHLFSALYLFLQLIIKFNLIY
mgnify:CR=1 FL=1